MWIFALDDLSDDWSVPLPELLARTAGLFVGFSAGAAVPPIELQAASVADTSRASTNLGVFMRVSVRFGGLHLRIRK